MYGTEEMTKSTISAEETKTIQTQESAEKTDADVTSTAQKSAMHINETQQETFQERKTVMELGEKNVTVSHSVETKSKESSKTGVSASFKKDSAGKAKELGEKLKEYRKQGINTDPSNLKELEQCYTDTINAYEKHIAKLDKKKGKQKEADALREELLQFEREKQYLYISAHLYDTNGFDSEAERYDHYESDSGEEWKSKVRKVERTAKQYAGKAGKAGKVVEKGLSFLFGTFNDFMEIEEEPQEVREEKKEEKKKPETWDELFDRAMEKNESIRQRYHHVQPIQLESTSKGKKTIDRVCDADVNMLIDKDINNDTGEFAKLFIKFFSDKNSFDGFDDLCNRMAICQYHKDQLVTDRGDYATYVKTLDSEYSKVLEMCETVKQSLVNKESKQAKKHLQYLYQVKRMYEREQSSLWINYDAFSQDLKNHEHHTSSITVGEIVNLDMCNEAKELRKLGFRSADLKACKPEFRENVLRSAQTMFKQFPQLKEQHTSIRCYRFTKLHRKEFARHGVSHRENRLTGDLNLNADSFGSDHFLKELEKDCSSKSAPKGCTSIESVLYHEYGHMLVSHLIAKRINGLRFGLQPTASKASEKEEQRTRIDQFFGIHRAYKKDEKDSKNNDAAFKKDIVENACKESKVKFGTAGFRNALSRYGASNYDEAIAEAVREVMVKGNNARPLSRKIYENLVAELDNK